MGGYEPASVNSISPGSRLHHLALFSLSSLQAACTRSETNACAKLVEASFNGIESVQQQVVAGMKYRIDARTSAGRLRLLIFEQPWGSPVLELQEAILLPGPQEAPADVIRELGSDHISLDVDAFQAFSHSRSSRTSALLVGDAPGVGGGHYTGSDAEIFANIVHEKQTEQRLDQWWLIAFFLLGVSLVVALAVAGRRIQPTDKSDKEPINPSNVASSHPSFCVSSVDCNVKVDGDAAMA